MRSNPVSHISHGFLRVAATLMTTVLLAGCSDGSAEDQANGPPSPSQGSAKGSAIASHWITGKPIRIDLLSLDRVTPKLVLLRFRLTNLGSQGFIIDHRLGASYNTDVSETKLIDIAAQKHYYPFYAVDDKCVCSIFEATEDADITVDPQQSVPLFAYFPAPPSDLERISVGIPEAPPFIDVPIGSKSRPVPNPEGQPKRNPFALDLNAPFTKPIVSVVDSLNGNKSVEEDDDSREVTLSADVLFELNESSLTAKARKALQEVAGDIDHRKPKVVHIDGYTDSSGSSDINDPLSQDRANAVEKALKGLVKSPNVSFEAEGHGADDPVAPNDTEEGRQKNRRVTITYNK